MLLQSQEPETLSSNLFQNNTNPVLVFRPMKEHDYRTNTVRRQVPNYMLLMFSHITLQENES